jgi:hypothetical protein
MPELVHLGKGRCRGDGWATKVWPIEMERLTVAECAKECASRKHCLAFDVSRPEKDGKHFHCTLYGHRGVHPAYAVQGDCFSLRDRVDDARDLDDDDDFFEEEEEEEGDDDDTKRREPT